MFVGDEAFVCLVLCDLCLFESNKKLLTLWIFLKVSDCSTLLLFLPHVSSSLRLFTTRWRPSPVSALRRLLWYFKPKLAERETERGWLLFFMIRTSLKSAGTQQQDLESSESVSQLISTSFVHPARSHCKWHYYANMHYSPSKSVSKAQFALIGSRWTRPPPAAGTSSGRPWRWRPETHQTGCIISIF